MAANIFLLTVSAALTPGNPSHLDNVKALFPDQQRSAAPGCAIGVFRAGKPLLLTASGAADVAKGSALNADTLFYSASVSKQFTALAAVKLGEQGKLDLDQDIRKYLPELPQYEVPVTARMLMMHTAGIRDWLELIRLAGVPSARHIAKPAVVQMLLRQKGTNFTPGSAYTYSNGGYLLLAEIIERISGMPFPAFAKRAILQPLGMKRSFFMDGTAPAGQNIAHGYVPVGDGFEVRDTYPTFSGSGGLMISISDLARFERDIEIGRKVWTPYVARTMTTAGTYTSGLPVTDPNTGLGYGGGLMIGQRNGQRFVQHGGSAEAFKNMYARLPERRLAVAILCNRSDWVAQQKADAVIEAIEGDILTADPRPASPTRSPAGRYRSEELMTTYDVSTSAEGLRVQISSDVAPARSQLDFYPAEGGFLGKGNTRLVVDRDGRGFTIKTPRLHAIHFRRID